jgi:erythromycin esterase-like protein
MAYVFRSIRQLRYPKLRTALWAHNVHIWESPHPLVNWASMMGTHLRAAYGRGYVTLGLVGSLVEIDSPGFIGCDPRPAPPADSVEAKLESLGTGGALLADLAGPARPPFFPPGQTWVLERASVEPRNYFDGIIWLQHSPAMNPIGQQSCR